MKSILIWVVMIACICIAFDAGAQGRFPQPQFESGYKIPAPTTPQPVLYEYLDVALLVVALSLAAFLTLKHRDRRWVFALMVACLAYFGFWRNGCICPVGSVQNVVLSLSSDSYTVPWPVVVFFLMPLVFALLFGRVFCAAVCPLGGIQDLAVVKPLRLPGWLSQGLGLIPYAYLGAAALLVATGSGFIICRFDPFVSLFRLSGSTGILIFGAVVLITGIFVARPYCRFMCPYGVLLNWMSRFSWRHVTITPDECIQCRLCEDACPFDAIRKPASSAPRVYRDSAVRRVALLLVILPLLVLGCGWIASRLEVPMSLVNRDVRLAERLAREDAGLEDTTTEETDAFREAGESSASLNQRVWLVREQTRLGLWILGGSMGLVIGGKLIRLSVYRSRTDYEPDRGECLSCARCFSSCPKEHERRKGSS